MIHDGQFGGVDGQSRKSPAKRNGWVASLGPAFLLSSNGGQRFARCSGNRSARATLRRGRDDPLCGQVGSSPSGGVASTDKPSDETLVGCSGTFAGDKADSVKTRVEPTGRRSRTHGNQIAPAFFDLLAQINGVTSCAAQEAAQDDLRKSSARGTQWRS